MELTLDQKIEIITSLEAKLNEFYPYCNGSEAVYFTNRVQELTTLLTLIKTCNTITPNT